MTNGDGKGQSFLSHLQTHEILLWGWDRDKPGYIQASISELQGPNSFHVYLKDFSLKQTFNFNKNMQTNKKKDNQNYAAC